MRKKGLKVDKLIQANTVLLIMWLILPGFIANSMISGIGKTKLGTHRYAWLSFFAVSLFSIMLTLVIAFVLDGHFCWRDASSQRCSLANNVVKTVVAMNKVSLTQIHAAYPSLSSIGYWAFTLSVAAITVFFAFITTIIGVLIQHRKLIVGPLSKLLKINDQYSDNLNKLIHGDSNNVVTVRLLNPITVYKDNSTSNLQQDTAILAYEGVLEPDVLDSSSFHIESESSDIFLMLLGFELSNGTKVNARVNSSDEILTGVWISLSNIASIEKTGVGYTEPNKKKKPRKKIVLPKPWGIFLTWVSGITLGFLATLAILL